MGVLDRLKRIKTKVDSYVAKREKEKIKKHNKSLKELASDIRSAEARLKKKRVWEGRKKEKKELREKLSSLKRQESRTLGWLHNAEKRLDKEIDKAIKFAGKETKKFHKSRTQPTKKLKTKSKKEKRKTKRNKRRKRSKK